MLIGRSLDALWVFVGLSSICCCRMMFVGLSLDARCMFVECSLGCPWRFAGIPLDSDFRWILLGSSILGSPGRRENKKNGNERGANGTKQEGFPPKRLPLGMVMSDPATNFPKLPKLQTNLLGGSFALPLPPPRRLGSLATNFSLE